MRTGLIITLLVLLSTGLSAQTPSELYESAMKFKAKENYTEAVRLLRKALDQEPGSRQYKMEMADLQYQKHAYFEAIPLYEEMLLSDENNVVYLTRLSEMYSMSPQKQKCVLYAERAEKLKPEDGESYRKIARSYYEVKHFPKAIKLYQEAEKRLPADMDIPYKIASCYESIHDYNNAMKYFDKSLALDPDNATKIYQTALCCYDVNNFNRALNLFQQAEDKGYYKTTSFYDNWSNACFELKDYNQALFYLSKAKELAPYDKDINFSIAEAYMKKGDYSKTREILGELLDINPNDAEAIYTIGMTYYKAGNTSKAEGYFNKAFEIDPSLRSLRYVKANF